MESKKLIYADDARRAILETEPKLAYCIERIKAVDAVEVVRCKDCAYRHSSEFCECRPEDGYCNDGERKEE